MTNPLDHPASSPGLPGQVGPTWAVPVPLPVPAPAPAADTAALGPLGRPAEDLDDRDNDLFGTDADFVAPHRANRVTALLLAGLVAVGGFAGGVLVQKSHDAGLTSGSAGAATSRFRTAGGAGGFAGFGAGSGSGGQSAGGGAPGTGAGGGTAAGGDAATTGVPVVVGTISAVKPTGLTVTNFAGTAVPVRLTATTTVTATGTIAPAPGAPVSVFGTKNADGSVTATAVIARARTAN